jgi:hyperosmotically inducible periplasmic protein
MRFALALSAALLVAAPALAQQTTEAQRDKNRAENKERMHNIGLTGKVKSALASDVGLKTLKIDVDTDEGGIVTLKGSVDSPETKARAEQVAKKVEGVKQVKNELKVKGG